MAMSLATLYHFIMSERNDILSKEQLLRIERNRQLAKERLLAKRNVFNPVSGNSEKNGFPAEKKLRFNDPRMQPTVDPMQSSSYSCSKTPALSKPVLYNSDLQKQYFPKPEVKNNSVGADRRPNKQGKCHALSKGCHSGLPHSKQKIKANFVVLSRETFQVDVPYDAQVNALFKQMSNKLYGKVYILPCCNYYYFILLYYAVLNVELNVISMIVFPYQTLKRPHGASALEITTAWVSFLSFIIYCRRWISKCIRA